MPTYQGQTDQVLRIQLPSAILFARFLEGRFPANAEVAFEVMTLYVGNSAPIEIDFVDDQGSVLHTHKGTVHNNVHRASLNARILIPKPGPRKKVQMKVRLPKHGLSQVSDWADIDSPIAITDVCLKDAGGNLLDKVRIGDTVQLSAKFLGEADQLPCTLDLEVSYSDHRALIWQSFATEVKEGNALTTCKITRHQDEAKFLAQHKTKPLAIAYSAPQIHLRATCLGVSANSSSLPLLSQTQITVSQKARARIELPTGEEKLVELVPGQPVDVPDNQMGVYRLLNLEPVDEEGQPLDNQVMAGHPDLQQANAEEEEPLVDLPPMSPAT